MSFACCRFSSNHWCHSSTIRPMLNLFPKALGIIHLWACIPRPVGSFWPSLEKKDPQQNSATHLHEVLLGQDTLLKYASYAESDLASEVSSSCVNGVSLATYSIREVLINAVEWAEWRLLSRKSFTGCESLWWWWSQRTNISEFKT